MKRDTWKGKTRKGKQVTYTYHERTAEMADITAKVEGEENFRVQLDIPLPVNRAEVETRFAAELANEE
jgi:hypothetical protein